jgi:hypothetical protein
MKKKFTTRRQVIELLTDLLVGNDKAPSKILLKLEDKLEGVASGSETLEITFDEGKGFYTTVSIAVGEPESFNIEDEDDGN